MRIHGADHEEMLWGVEIFHIVFGALLLLFFFWRTHDQRVSSLKHRCNSVIFAGLNGVDLGLCKMYWGDQMSGLLEGRW